MPGDDRIACLQRHLTGGMGRIMQACMMQACMIRSAAVAREPGVRCFAAADLYAER